MRKAFEPYVNLWSTAEEWTESYDAWTKGSFLAIDAEVLEADVERCAREEEERFWFQPKERRDEQCVSSTQQTKYEV